MSTTFELLENEVVHDEAFVVRKSRYGLFNSFTVKGRAVLTGADEENVTMMTRWHLKSEQDGWPEDTVSVVGSASKMVDL